MDARWVRAFVWLPKTMDTALTKSFRQDVDGRLIDVEASVEVGWVRK